MFSTISMIFCIISSLIYLFKNRPEAAALWMIVAILCDMYNKVEVVPVLIQEITR